MVNGCQNNDLNELYLYFSTGKDLSSYNFENYNFYDLWNAVENGATPPERNPCNSSYIASVRSCTLAVLGNFTTINDFVGFNRDFYNLYLLIIGQEPILTPSFDSDCVARLYSVFSIGLTGKWRQPQDLTAVLSKSAALAFVQWQQEQNFDALLSKSAALDAVQFLQGQAFNVELVSYAYLLDDYPNAAAAYSVRLLKSDYTGALVRIRKDTAGQPEKDFYPDSNNELSLNSSDGGTTLGSWIGSNNGYIVSFYDQSGNNLDLTQSSASAQPQILSSGSLITDNGKAALEFNGLTNSRQLIINSSTIFNEDASIFTVASSNDNTAEQSIYNLQIDTINRQFSLGYNRAASSSIGSSIRLSDSSFVNSGDSISDMTQRLYSQIGICSTSTNSLYIDGVSATNTYSPRSTSANSIGSRVGAFYLDGKVQELVLWESDKSSDLTGIQSNINDFYSIY